MSFLRFNVLNSLDEQQSDGIDYPILINDLHIASLKPINIMFNGNIINGYWIRLINGKKYKATRIPKELEVMIEDDLELTAMVMNAQSDDQGPPEVSFH